jgi:hypothetical protein
MQEFELLQNDMMYRQNYKKNAVTRKKMGSNILTRAYVEQNNVQSKFNNIDDFSKEELFRRLQASEEQEIGRQNGNNSVNNWKDIMGNTHSGRMVIIAEIAQRLDLTQYRNATKFSFDVMDIQSLKNFKD